MMSPDEQELCESLGFDPVVCEALKTTTGAHLHRLQGWDPENEIATPLEGVGAKIEESKAAEAREELQSGLPSGYLAFWGDRNILGHETELGILKTADRFQIVRAKGTSAAEFDLTTTQIVDQLREWSKRCHFSVSGAAHDWVALTFETLPDHLDDFAREIYDFCPDTVDQHFGCFGEAAAMMREMGQAVPPAMGELIEGMDWSDPEAAGLHVLVRSLARDKYLFLWWDEDE